MCWAIGEGVGKWVGGYQQGIYMPLEALFLVVISSKYSSSSSSSYPFYSPLSSTEGWTCLTSLLLRRPLHSERF